MTVTKEACPAADRDFTGETQRRREHENGKSKRENRLLSIFPFVFSVPSLRLCSEFVTITSRRRWRSAPPWRGSLKLPHALQGRKQRRAAVVLAGEDDGTLWAAIYRLR